MLNWSSPLFTLPTLTSAPALTAAATNSASTGAPVRVDSGFTSLDELQFALATYLLTRVPFQQCRPLPRVDDDFTPSTPADWPEAGVGRGGDAAHGEVPADTPLAPNLTFCPQFIFEATVDMACPGPVGATRCALAGGESSLDLGSRLGHKTSHLAALVVRTVIGDAANPTPLRLLLDLELGEPVRVVRHGLVYVAQFTHGLAVVHPGMPPMVPRRVEQVDVGRFLPRLATGGRATGLLMEIDFCAVDRYLERDEVGRAGLPEWVLSTPTASLPHLHRFALEAGLAAPFAGPLGFSWGPYGSCAQLRRIDDVVTLLPASARIILFEDAPYAAKWRAYLGAPLAGRRCQP